MAALASSLAQRFGSGDATADDDGGDGDGDDGGDGDGDGDDGVMSPGDWPPAPRGTGGCHQRAASW